MDWSKKWMDMSYPIRVSGTGPTEGDGDGFEPSPNSSTYIDGKNTEELIQTIGRLADQIVDLKALDAKRRQKINRLRASVRSYQACHERDVREINMLRRANRVRVTDFRSPSLRQAIREMEAVDLGQPD